MPATGCGNGDRGQSPLCALQLALVAQGSPLGMALELNTGEQPWASQMAVQKTDWANQ